MRPILTAILILAAALLAACGDGAADDSAATAPAAKPVVTAQAIRAPSAALVRGTGTIAFKREVPLSFKIAGVIAELLVDQSDPVAAGQVLARLDQAEIGAQLRDAEAQLTKARRDVARLLPLVAKGHAPRARLDDARTAAAMAAAARDSVAFNRSLSVIVAPGDGVVLTRHVEAGQIVTAGAAILTVADGRAGHVARLPLSDRDIVRVGLGDPARVTLAGLPEPLAGHVTRRAAMGDPRTGTFEVEVAIDHPPPGLTSGLIADIAITTTLNRPAALLAIPATAILEGFGDWGTVYVVAPTDRTVARRRVRFGGMAGDDVLVAEGLDPGEVVVATGAAYLAEGDRVAPAGP